MLPDPFLAKDRSAGLTRGLSPLFATDPLHQRRMVWLAVFEYVKLDGQLKLAALRYEAGQYRPAAHAAEVAADKRAAAQKKMKEHKALHRGLRAEVAID